MLTKKQEADAQALQRMIMKAFQTTHPEPSELLYYVLGGHALKPGLKARKFPMEVWEEVAADFERRGFTAFVRDARTLVVAAP